METKDEIVLEFGKIFDTMYLEECDCCHDVFGIHDILITECGQFLCYKCNNKG